MRVPTLLLHDLADRHRRNGSLSVRTAVVVARKKKGQN